MACARNDNFEDQVRQRFCESIEVKQKAVDRLASRIAESAEKMAEALKRGGKLVFLGNGGSAADAQHLAAEFVGRFKMERPGLPALALNTNSSTITAIGNDYSYDEIFSRQVDAFAGDNDVLIAISTSGNSECVCRAVESAARKGCFTIGLTGEGGGRMAGMVDILLDVPARDTARVQETHITIGHILCELVENEVCQASLV